MKKYNIYFILALIVLICGCVQIENKNSQMVKNDDTINDTTIELSKKEQQIEPVASSNDRIVFKTTTVNDEEIDTDQLFSKNKITMLNFWASWCPPCIGEMPELESINNEIKNRGGEIVGVLCDSNDDQGLKDGLEVIKQANVNYTILKTNETIENMFPLQAYPTTYFIDSEGKIVGEPVVGAYINEYKRRLEKALE